MHASGRGAALLGAIAAAFIATAPAAAPDGGSAPAGTYLAARAARATADLPRAADLFAEALEADPADPWLLGNALSANLGLGRIEQAQALAARIVEAGLQSPYAHLVLDLGHARDGDWRGLLSELEAGRGVAPLVDGLTRGWAWAGLNDSAAAASAFDELGATPAFRSFALYHKALALAVGGNLAGAQTALASDGLQRTPRVVLAQAQVLAALGRPEEAMNLIDAAFGADLDAPLADLRARLAANEPVAFTLVATPAEGLAETYFSLAAVLAPEDSEAGLLYARAALALDPSHAEAAILAARLLEDLGQPALAREAYGLVPASDPLTLGAEIGRAGVLQSEDLDEAALEVLSRLAQDHPDSPEAQTALADHLRRMESFAEAEAAYGRAIALLPEGAGRLWYLHFMRALAHEGQADWPATESDLRAALRLNPDQPQVLNHLGYSLVDRGEKLDEAMEMIARAVDLRPDSGAIVDSLGWAYFRLGRYAEAVEQLELASTLLSTDPVINDHLGDAYWKVGRTREARFQWTRALSFEPAEADEARIRLKLAQGLDAVLAAEADDRETTALADEASGG
ncbi:tetratricopeptide repeat protein [Rubellimicrobium roseum]|uniref:Tetratricopeptide repeat protein n=1 Tax=Rubellimicrobium roseum TaxID=687525 RepID=A0A5C4NHG7_9RHOB|nr:tetratricopeptide repeat protein [Rubellimicrobium roseum]TNC74201.1 tetratricopeptide repeat protein [Rubellimicrobium roseum]